MRAKVLCFIALSAALPCAAQTKVSLEHYVAVMDGEPTPEITGFISHDFRKSPHGLFLFGWGERSHKRNHGYGLAGYTIKPETWIQVGFGAGVSEDFQINRAGIMMSAEGRGFKAFGIMDGGRGRPWYTATISTPAWKRLGGRFQSETHLGTGPGMQFTIGPVTLWGAIPYDRHEAKFNTVFGIALESHLPFGREKGH